MANPAIQLELACALGDRDVRLLRWICDRFGDERLGVVVVVTGAYVYRRPDGITVVPAAPA